MTDRLPHDRAAPAFQPNALAALDQPPPGLLAGMALALTSWRRRVRYAREFRGFDRYQLRDLGLSPFDQW